MAQLGPSPNAIEGRRFGKAVCRQEEPPETLERSAIAMVRSVMNFTRLLLAFGKSVAIGALVGAAPFLLLTLPMGAGLAINPPRAEATPWDGLLFAVLPLIVSGALVLAGSVMLGLPTYWLLARTKREAATIYTLWGAAWGAVAGTGVQASVGFGGGVWMIVLGAASGAATGLRWGRSKRAEHRPASGEDMSGAER